MPLKFFVPLARSRIFGKGGNYSPRKRKFRFWLYPIVDKFTVNRIVDDVYISVHKPLDNVHNMNK